MSTSGIPVLPLTRAGFEPFGEVIEIREAEHFEINDGFATRYHNLANLELHGNGGQPLINIFRARPRQLPMRVEAMERHPLGSQAFMPMGELRWMVVVAAADTDGSPQPPIAFQPRVGQGVNYRRGTWHHALITLDAGDFMVIDRGGAGENLAVHSYPKTLYQLAPSPK